MAASARGLLSGRLAVVTGGASGIGQAVCRTLAGEGASVAVVDINHDSALATTKGLLQGGSVQHHCFKADVGDKKEVDSLMERVLSQYERAPCIVVNSAGIFRDNHFLKMDENDFDQVINTNLKGTYLLTQAVAKAMVEKNVQNGSIINISSIAGKVGMANLSNYAASKAGVIGLTKTCAQELARLGIRCNSILPGFIDTPMTQSYALKNEAPATEVIANIPLGRSGKPEEVAEVALFLASHRSSYITGACVEVTGGLFM